MRWHDEEIGRFCSKIRLSCVFGISNNFVTTIINHLKHSLEEIDLSSNDITLDKFMEFKSMPKLRILNFLEV